MDSQEIFHEITRFYLCLPSIRKMLLWKLHKKSFTLKDLTGIKMLLLWRAFSELSSVVCGMFCYLEADRLEVEEALRLHSPPNNVPNAEWNQWSDPWGQTVGNLKSRRNEKGRQQVELLIRWNLSFSAVETQVFQQASCASVQAVWFLAFFRPTSKCYN